ncbi:MAG TPA: porin family protein [Vicinamibacterales bacterium]|nr:porin family protein [Vicinamibacterales bacterium]
MIQRHITRAAAALLVVLGSASPLFAQIPGLGVKAGVNIATVKSTGGGSEDAGFSSLTALVAGAFTTFRVASWLEFQPEALYSVKGTQIDERTYTSKALVDYLEVPMLARVSRRGNGRTGFYVAGGPYVAVRLRARTRTTFGDTTEEVDVSDAVERLDFGISAGGGFEWGRAVFDGRYSLGLKDIDKDRTDDAELRTRTITVTAGFRF